MIQTTDIEHKEVLTVSDVCTHLGMSRDKVMDLIREEGLPAIQFQRLWRIPKETLNEWLQERTRTATDQRRARDARREDAAK